MIPFRAASCNGPALPSETPYAQKCGTADQIFPQPEGSAVHPVVALIKPQHVLRNFNKRFTLRDRTDRSKRMRVRHHPPLRVYVLRSVRSVAHNVGESPSAELGSFPRNRSCTAHPLEEDEKFLAIAWRTKVGASTARDPPLQGTDQRDRCSAGLRLLRSSL